MIFGHLFIALLIPLSCSDAGRRVGGEVSGVFGAATDWLALEGPSDRRL